jgi:hypothetical protein
MVEPACAVATRRRSDDNGSDRRQFAPTRPRVDHRPTIARRGLGQEYESASGGGRREQEFRRWHVVWPASTPVRANPAALAAAAISSPVNRRKGLIRR